MDKMTGVFVGGKVWLLRYSMGALFEIAQKYGSVEKALDLIQPDTPEAMEVTCNIISILAREAELYRRANGLLEKAMFDKSSVSTLMRPGEFLHMKKALTDAIALGYEQDFEPITDETDLGLLELQKNGEAGV